MLVWIEGTREMKELNLIKPETGNDYAVDFIKRFGGFENGDIELINDEYIMSQAAFNNWVSILYDFQIADNKLASLKKAILKSGNFDLLEQLETEIKYWVDDSDVEYLPVVMTNVIEKFSKIQKEALC